LRTRFASLVAGAASGGWVRPDLWVHTDVLPQCFSDDAVALWHAAGLTRPLNDPFADLRRALGGPSSTVLAAVRAGRVIGTVMVGHDGLVAGSTISPASSFRRTCRHSARVRGAIRSHWVRRWRCALPFGLAGVPPPAVMAGCADLPSNVTAFAQDVEDASVPSAASAGTRAPATAP
jgi:hypothetical protein